MISDDLRSLYHRTQWALILRGLLGLAIGAFILARPLDSVAVFALVIAVWALADGITAVVYGIALRDVVPHWGWLLAGGIVSIGFGVAALYYYPGLSLAFSVAFAAYWLLLTGGIAIWVSVQERRNQLSWGWTMVFGLVSVVAGVLALVYPGLTLSTLMALIAAFGIVGGVARLVGAVRMRAAARRLRETVDSRRASSTSRGGNPPDYRSVA